MARKLRKILQILLILAFQISVGALYASEEEKEKIVKFNSIIKNYETELEKDPKNIKLIVAIAQVYYALGEYVQAIEYYKQALELEPQNRQIQGELGLAYLNSNNFIESDRLFKQILSEDPTNVSALAGTGRIEALNQHTSQAEALYQQALAQDPKNFTTLFYLADLEIEKKQYSDAEKILTSLLEQAPHASWVSEALERAKLGPILDQIAGLEKQKEYELAIDVANRQLGEHPDSIPLHLALSRLYNRSENYAAAISLLNNILEKYPDNNALRMALAFSYLAKNDFLHAEELLNSLLRSGTNISEVTAGLGRVAALKGDLNKAEKFYNESLLLNPSYPLALSYLAELKMEQKKYKESEEIYEKILSLNPDATWAKEAINNVKSASMLEAIEQEEKNNNFEAAKKLYDKLLNAFPYNINNYIRFSLFYRNQRRYEDAIDIALRGLNIDPNAVSLYLTLGYDYLLNGEFDKSKKAFFAALNHEPHNSEALAGIGRLNALEGDSDAALQLYQQLLETNPNNMTALSYLIDLRWTQKEYEEIEKLATKVLEIDPKAKWAKEMLLKAKYGNLFDEVKALETAGLPQQAISLLQELLEKAPDSEEVYLELGRLYSKLKLYDKAVATYKAGLENDRSSNALAVGLGLAYINMGELKAAYDILQRVYKRDPHNDQALAALGRVAALEGDKSLARKLYTTALQINPNSSLSLSFFAELLRQEKQFAEAEKMYEQILQIDKTAFWAKKALDEVKDAPLLEEVVEKEKKGHFAEAEASYLKLIEKFPNNADYYIKLANLYIKIKREQEAINLYKKGLEALPSSLPLTVGLGFAYLAKGELSSGEEIFSALLKQDPKNSEALAGLGRYAELSGNKKSAIDLYQQALTEDPNNITALIFLAQQMMLLERYKEAQELYQRIYNLQPSDWVKQALVDAKHGHALAEIKKRENAKDYKVAEALWEQLLKEESSSYYYLGAGFSQQKAKKYEEAIDIFLQGIKNNPNSSELYAALGMAYISKKNYIKAHDAFEMSLKLDPKNPDGLAGLGYIAKEEKKFETAKKLLHQAIDSDPNSIMALSTLGQLLIEEKHYPEAKAVYEKLLTLQPDEKWIKLALDDVTYGKQLDLIKTLIKNDQFAKAAEIYRQLLRESPENPNFYFGLGQMQMRLKEYQQSIITNSTGLKKNPEANELRIALGYAYFFNKNLAKARKVLSKAVELDPKDPEALAGLGHVNALEGSYGPAEQLYLAALQIDPKNQSAMSFYGDMLMKQKRYSEAQDTFSSLKKILPDAVWVTRALQDAIDGPVTNIANELSYREEFELAADLYRQLIASAPEDPARYLPLGQMYENLQQYCRAIKIFNIGLFYDPEAWSLWRGIAFTYILMEEYARSSCIFYALLENDINDAEAWAGLGRIQALNGSFCLARTYYLYALAIDPGNLTALSFLADLQQNEEFNFSALYNYEKIYEVVQNTPNPCDLIPKWVYRGYNKALNLTQPILSIAGAYHQEKQWDPQLSRWSAEYLVYGGTGKLNYPVSDFLVLSGEVTNQFYTLKDFITHTYIYSFDVQRFALGERWVFSPCLYLDARAGGSTYSQYHCSSFRLKEGVIGEPSVTLVFHAPIRKATLGFLTASDLVARDFQRNIAKLVGYYTAVGTYEQKIMQRGWIGLEANMVWYRDFVHNTSQKALGWMQWRPPCFSDNIVFRYFLKYQTFSKNIPDYYTYKPQIVNHLQVTLEKSWRVCWADTFYTSLGYAHGWQDTRTRFAQIIVIAPQATLPAMAWDHRQYNTLFGTLIYKYNQLQFTLTADYYRDTEKYTMATIGAGLAWRF